MRARLDLEAILLTAEATTGRNSRQNSPLCLALSEPIPEAVGRNDEKHSPFSAISVCPYLLLAGTSERLPMSLFFVGETIRRRHENQYRLEPVDPVHPEPSLAQVTRSSVDPPAIRVRSTQRGSGRVLSHENSTQNPRRQ